MKRFLLLCTAILLMPTLALAFPQKNGDKECTACHKLDKKDAEAIVKKLVATGIITEIKMAPAKGIWQIEVDAGEGKHGTLYMDFSKKNLIIGQLVPVDQIGRPTPPRKVELSKIPLGDAVIVGAKDAPKKVIVFSDPDCPYCRRLHESIKQVVQKRKDVAFAIILHPLPMHKEAYKKSQAVQCSKSLEMLDDAFSGKSVPEPAEGCTPDAIERNKALAKSLDFGGTPTLVRDDGLVMSGFMPEDKLIDWIDKKQ